VSSVSVVNTTWPVAPVVSVKVPVLSAVGVPAMVMTTPAMPFAQGVGRLHGDRVDERPAATLLGCVTNDIADRAPALMMKELDVALRAPSVAFKV